MNVLSASQKLARLKAVGLSGAEISRLTGISQPTISRIERGLHASPKETAVRAIDLLFESQTGTNKAA